MSTPKLTDAEFEAACRKWHRKVFGSPVRITFWGTMILDPDKVFVTHEQARRSAENIRRWIAKQHKLDADATRNDATASQ